MPDTIGKKDFENTLKLTKKALWISGTDLLSDNTRNSPINPSFLFYFNLLWLHSNVCGEFYCLHEFVKAGKTFEEMSIIAPFPFVCVLATVKTASIYFNKETVLLVSNKLRSIHPKVESVRKKVPKTNNMRTKVSQITESQIVQRTYKLLFKYINTYMYLVLFLDVTLFCMLPICSMVLDYYHFGSTDLKLPYYVQYFFDPYTMPWWLFEYLHQVGSSLIVTFNIFGSDSLFYAFCFYVRMHFEILCERFERLTDTERDTAKKLRELISRHQELIELVNQIQEIYSTSMLFHIIISSFTIGLCGFNITFIKDTGIAFAFFNLLVLSVYQIYMVCFFGDIISESSTKVSDTIYKLGWYKTDTAIKSNILIIIMRSQKPCSLSAAKYATLNLRAFTKILSRSWSYFALLKTIYK